MNFSKNTGWFLKFFFRFGLAPNLTENCTKNKSCYLFRETIVVVMQTIILYYMAISVAIGVYSGEYSNYYSKADVTFVYLFTLCEIAKGSSVFIQRIFKRYSVYNIISTYQKLELFFANHLGYRIEYGAFRKQYIAKVSAVLYSYVQYIVVNILRRFLRSPKSPVIYQFKILQFISALNFLHIIFYIDLLSFHLNELSSAIQKDIIRRNDHNLNDVAFFCKRPTIRDKIKYYKYIHFRLWEVARQLNCYFGWCMVPVLLFSFVEVVYFTYWLAIMVQETSSFFEIFCKSNLLNFKGGCPFSIQMSPCQKNLHMDSQLMILTGAFRASSFQS